MCMNDATQQKPTATEKSKKTQPIKIAQSPVSVMDAANMHHISAASSPLVLELADTKSPSRSRKPRVLIVDDTSSVRIMTQKLTSGFVTSYDEMKSGEEFLEYALSDLPSHRYDIIILDNNMGGIDGIEALQRARSSGYVGKVIMVTADSDPIKVELYHQFADMYLHKKPPSKAEYLNAFRHLYGSFSLDT